MSWIKNKFNKLFKMDVNEEYDEYEDYLDIKENEQLKPQQIDQSYYEEEKKPKKTFRFPLIEDEFEETPREQVQQRQTPKEQFQTRQTTRFYDDDNEKLSLPNYLQKPATHQVYDVEVSGIRDLLERRRKGRGQANVVQSGESIRRLPNLKEEREGLRKKTVLEENSIKMQHTIPIENKKRFVPTDVPSPVHGFKKATSIEQLLEKQQSLDEKLTDEERQEEHKIELQNDQLESVKVESVAEHAVEKEQLIRDEHSVEEQPINSNGEEPFMEQVSIAPQIENDQDKEFILFEEEVTQTREQSQQASVVKQQESSLVDDEVSEVEEKQDTSVAEMLSDMQVKHVTIENSTIHIEQLNVEQMPQTDGTITVEQKQREEISIQQSNAGSRVPFNVVMLKSDKEKLLTKKFVEQQIEKQDDQIEEDTLAQLSEEQEQPVSFTQITDEYDQSEEPIMMGASTTAIGVIEREESKHEQIDEMLEVAADIEVPVLQYPEVADREEIPVVLEASEVEEATVIQAAEDVEEVSVVQEAVGVEVNPEVQGTINVEEASAVQEVVEVEVNPEVQGTLNVEEASVEQEAVEVEVNPEVQGTINVEEASAVQEVVEVEVNPEVQGTINVEEASAVQEVVEVEVNPEVQEDQSESASVEGNQLLLEGNDYGKADPGQTVEEEQQIEVQQVKKPIPYVKPPLEYLVPPEEMVEDRDWMDEQGENLVEALSHFQVQAHIESIVQGPAVTQFEITVGQGTKVSKVRNLTDDIKLALAAKDIRIDAPIPGKRSIGIEIPNRISRSVRLSEVTDSDTFRNSDSPLEAALGLDLAGKPVTIDLRKMPHGLIAGATGSGKSVCINSILVSLLYKSDPNELKLMLIDPKMVELAPFNHIPHLVSPVITDVKAATAALKWAVEEMERRYQLFMHSGARKIEAYNKMCDTNGMYAQKLPYLLIVIDELADLMMMSPQDVEDSIVRITQKARAAGIHLIVATQRPSVDVITGLIKSNIPTRIAFSVSSQIDSRTILDAQGAERLLGRGDMLYLGNGMSAPTRIQGTFVTDDEIEEIIEFVREQGEPQYIFKQEELLKRSEAVEDQDELFEEVCRFVFEQGSASTSLLQRRYHIGYNRAARLIDMLERQGYVSEPKGSKPRDVFITEEDLIEQFGD